ncbi:MAG: hypothetical protein HRU21_09195 [Pseudomonadales bacterium]|nr:hypothetical protein [Pseudomonadales bacterium]
MIKPKHIIWLIYVFIIVTCVACAIKKYKSSLNAPSETYTIEQAIECAILAEESGQYEYGDNGNALGILQIHPIMVREANRLLRRQEFDDLDRIDIKRSKMICFVFFVEQIRRYRLRYGKMPPIVILVGSWQSGAIETPAKKWYYKKAKKAWYKVKNGEC